MGDFKDAFGDNPTKAVQQIDQVISFVTAATTVAGVVVPGAQLVLQAIGLFGDTLDVTQQQISVIQQAFEALASQLNATDVTARMRQIAIVLQDARTQRDTLIHHLRTGDSGFASQEGFVRNNTLKAVNTLGDPSFWLRPLVENELYHDNWIGTSATGARVEGPTFDHTKLRPPRPSDLPQGLSVQVMFDWQLALPAYLDAISIRLMVLRALEPDFPNAFRDELSSMAKRLGEVHDTIVAGMTLLRVPTLRDTVYTRHPDTSFWDRRGRLYGAVEVFSAESTVQAWPDTEFPDPRELAVPGQVIPNPDVPDAPPRDDEFDVFLTDTQRLTYNHFVLRHALRSRRRWMDLYNKIGLNSLWSSIRTLAGLADVADLGHRWSVREIDRFAATALLGRPSTAPPGERIKVTQLVELLGFSRKGTGTLAGRRVGLKLALGAWGGGLF